MTMHRYQSHVAWQGSTGVGYAGYERTHRAVTPPAQTELRLSADPTFRGDPALHNPEQLLLVAASSCQLLSFLALAAQARLDVLGYEDDAEALMPADEQPMRISQVLLRPHITVGPGVDVEQVRQLVEQAHDGCYVANSLSAQVVVEPTVEHAAVTPTGAS